MWPNSWDYWCVNWIKWRISLAQKLTIRYMNSVVWWVRSWLECRETGRNGSETQINKQIWTCHKIFSICCWLFPLELKLIVRLIKRCNGNLWKPVDEVNWNQLIVLCLIFNNLYKKKRNITIRKSFEWKVSGSFEYWVVFNWI